MFRFAVAVLCLAPALSHGASGFPRLSLGSTIEARLVSGADIPVGDAARGLALPVLARTQASTSRPGGGAAAAISCFVILAASGDISTRRVQLQLQSFACVAPDGDVREAAAAGFVVGDDGKAGLRAELRRASGDALASAVATAFASGLVQSFGSARRAPLLVTSNGRLVAIVDLPTPGLRATGSALERLSDFYLGLAREQLPFLSLEAGRVLTIVLTRSVDLE